MDNFVLVTRKVFPETIDYLTRFFPVNKNQSDKIYSHEELVQRMKGAIGVQSSTSDLIDANLLDHCQKLKVISNTAVGYDNIDIRACTERGILVTNTPDVLNETVADYAMGLIIAACRQIPQGERYLRDKRWHKTAFTELLSRDVNGSIFGFMGFGRIGQAIAKRALSFNGKIIYHTRSRLPSKIEKIYQARYVEKSQLLESADVIILILPHSDETHHFIGETELGLMKNTSVLVNMARGGIVDDCALIKALRRGDIYSAALDVFEHEPNYYPDFLDLDNVVLSPHLGSSTVKTRRAMAMRAATNLVTGLKGDLPPDLINLEVKSSN